MFVLVTEYTQDTCEHSVFNPKIYTYFSDRVRQNAKNSPLYMSKGLNSTNSLGFMAAFGLESFKAGKMGWMTHVNCCDSESEFSIFWMCLLIFMGNKGKTLPSSSERSGDCYNGLTGTVWLYYVELHMAGRRGGETVKNADLKVLFCTIFNLFQSKPFG